MRILKAIGLVLGVGAIGLIVLVGFYVVASERVEVVVLHSHGPDGEHETRLWIVDDAGAAWLRTDRANATWLPRIRENPAVELERGGETGAYEAAVILEPEVITRISQLTLEKYGWSEEVMRSMAGFDPAASAVIRLDPR